VYVQLIMCLQSMECIKMGMGLSHSQMAVYTLADWNGLVSMCTLRLYRAFVFFVQGNVQERALEPWLQLFKSEMVRLFVCSLRCRACFYVF